MRFTRHDRYHISTKQTFWHLSSLIVAERKVRSHAETMLQNAARNLKESLVGVEVFRVTRLQGWEMYFYKLLFHV